MKKGFTLIELLAVLIILSLLAAIIVPNLNKSINNAKINNYKNNFSEYLTAINNAQANYVLLNNGTTTSNVEQLTIEFNNINKIKNPEIILNNDGEMEYVFAMLDDDYFCTYEKGLGTSCGKPKVYGLRWDSSTDEYTRLEDAVGLTANVGIGNTAVVNDFDEAEIYKNIEEITVDGNAFVKIPKFYIKKVVKDNIWEWYISIAKLDGYYLPECFYDYNTNKELKYVLIGKYDATISGDKFVSKSDEFLPIFTSIDEARPYATNNNTSLIKGYQLFDIHALDAIQVLFYVEFATVNSQSIMTGFTYGENFGGSQIASTSGNTITLTSDKGSKYRVGQLINIYKTANGTNLTDDVVDCKSNLLITAINNDTITFETTSGTVSNASIAVNYYVGNASYKTGSTDNVSASSGSMVSNEDGKYCMKYRGIENLYGNYYHLVDGIYKKNNVFYVSKNPLSYSNYDGENTDYYQIGYTPINSGINKFTSKMGYDSNNPFIQLPIEVNASSSSHYGDWFLNNASNSNTICFIAMGGALNLKANSGLTYYEMLSDTGGMTSARLMKKPI